MSFVDVIADASPIINEDDKPFNTGQHVFGMVRGVYDNFSSASDNFSSAYVNSGSTI